MHINSYLLVPACSKGNGTGHIRRMIDLYKDLKKNQSVSFFIPVENIPEVYKNLLDDGVEQNGIYTHLLPQDKHWDFIVVDYKNSPDKLINNLASKGFLIGIDEGCLKRGNFNYLIDIIPSLGNPVKPNILSTGIMDLPERLEYSSPVLFKKILISFGGEDPKGLTTALLEFFNTNNYFLDSDITVLSKSHIEPDKYSLLISHLMSHKNLKTILKDFDLIFTSFGLTAFESLASGVPFILLNPGSYHKKLSSKCGFAEIGVEKPNKKKLDRFIKKGADFRALQDKYIPQKYTKLKDLILSINISETICPVCQTDCSPSNIIHRFETRSFYSCPQCQITFQVNYLPLKDSYKKEYFFEDYKKQYGRTYLEDFKNIQVHAVERLEILNSIISDEKVRLKKIELLDVGCAYGPFLVESFNNGYQANGVEIIPEAAEYVRSELGFKVFTGPFEKAVFEKQFDVVTMWYVIEHFINPGEILTKVNRVLKPGGVFAFSTPSSTGISARKMMKEFFNNSPIDHITVWNPEISSRVLSPYGFKIVKIRNTGHHPERFPGYSVIKSKLGYKIVNLLSKIFKLGDTFEIYAVKIKELDV